MTQTNVFLPDNYLTSTMRALEEYVNDGFGLTGADDDPFTISMHYPDVENMAKTRLPLDRTLIHFEIDVNRNVKIGMGNNVFGEQYQELPPPSDPGHFDLIELEGRCHELELDVGVWASVESGGPTARMQAREVLDILFAGSAAYRACHEATDGIEILSFAGGRNLIDQINDLPIFRTVDLTLELRVYARYKKFPLPIIEGIDQHYEYIIDDDLTITGNSGETEPV